MRTLLFNSARLGAQSRARVRRSSAAQTLAGKVWRKPSCACGGSCPRCSAEESVQRKATISEPGDAFEREADAVADQVMRAAQPAAIDEMAATVQRRPSAQPRDSALDAEGAVQTASSGGTPLPASLRAFFEPRFGQDFGNVRIHDDGASANAARAVQARAYTYGSHIVFDAGEYAPDTSQGKRLLAHELTHVVQQQAGGGAVDRYVQRELEPAPVSDQSMQADAPTVGEGKGSQSYWYAKAELDTMQTRIKQIENTENPSSAHRAWLSRAKEAVMTAKAALDGGDKDGDYWGTYEMLKKVNADWPGPP